ncbi:MAG: helix-turn-helix domain-containing protein [Gammaproteobacteria bacterium]
MTVIQRAYRYRICPTAAQRRALARDFGAGRFVWNACLSWRSTAYKTDGEKLTGVDFSRELTWLKQLESYAWLGEVNSTVLIQMCAGPGCRAQCRRW